MLRLAAVAPRLADTLDTMPFCNSSSQPTQGRNAATNPWPKPPPQSLQQIPGPISSTKLLVAEPRNNKPRLKKTKNKDNKKKDPRASLDSRETPRGNEAH